MAENKEVGYPSQSDWSFTPLQCGGQWVVRRLFASFVSTPASCPGRGMLGRVLRRAMSVAAAPGAAARPVYATVAIIDAAENVVEVRLNRPDKSNAFNQAMWAELREVFQGLARVEDPCRAVILTGAGRNFTAGLDLQDHVSLLAPDAGSDPARRAWALRDMIRAYQDTITAVELCPKPVIAAVHGACVGAGVDLISAADVRLASSDAWFSIKEVCSPRRCGCRSPPPSVATPALLSQVDIGLAADVGTLQRLPRVVGNGSIVRELALTGRRWPAEEAAGHGFLSRVLADRDTLAADALALAVGIAAKSPVAVQVRGGGPAEVAGAAHAVHPS